MTKKLLQAVAVAVMAFTALGAFFIWRINPLLETFRPEISRRVSALVKHDVAIGQIKASLFPAPAIELHHLSLADGQRGAMTLEKASLSTSLGDLLRRNVNVSKITFTGGRVAVTREEDGSIYVGPLPVLKAADGKQEEQVLSTTAPGRDSEPRRDTVQFQIDDVELRDFAVSMLDKKAIPPQTITLDDADAKISGLGSGGRAAVDGKARLLGAGKNVHVAGTFAAVGVPFAANLEISLADLDLVRLGVLLQAYNIMPPELVLEKTASLIAALSVAGKEIEYAARLDAGAADMAMKDLFRKEPSLPFLITAEGFYHENGAFEVSKMETTLGGISISSPASVTPDGSEKAVLQTKTFPLATLGLIVPRARQFNPAGELSAAVETQKQPGGDWLEGLAGKIEIAGGAGDVPAGKESRLPLRAATATMLLDGRNLSFKPPFALETLGGSVTGSGELKQGQVLRLALHANKLSLAEMSRVFLAQSKFSVSGPIDAAALWGTLELADPAKTLAGTITVTAGHGSFNGFNLLGETLGKAEKLPVVGDMLIGLVPEKYQPLLKAGSTEYEQAELQAEVRNQVIEISSFRLIHSAYTLLVNGNAFFDGGFDLKGKLRLTPELTQAMAAKQEKMKLLLDQDGALAIPVVLEKKGEHIRVLPDFSDLGSRAATKTIKDEATKALDKLSPGIGKALEGLFKKR